MSNKCKIAIAGIGGVGGYYGGRLAAFYNNNNDVQINFVARGRHLDKIKKKGLQLITDTKTIVSHPYSITDDPEDLGELDLIIFCCKAYDLEELASRFSKNISGKTFLLPLLNGVDNTEKIQKLFPHAKTMYGCVYIISNMVSDGVIKVNGSFNNLLFGNPQLSYAELEKLEKIFIGAGIKCSLHQDVKTKIWEKFTFISPLASITSAYNLSIWQILNNENHTCLLLALMNEVIEVAKCDHINLPPNIIESNFEKLKKLPPKRTSSMQVDYANNKRTEVETLTGYVVNKASKANIHIPAYKKIYQILKKIK